MARDTQRHDFPMSAGVLLGLGLGGFFDGIVLHQILQWHHMVTSAGYPANSVSNLEFNTSLDGLFHALTYGAVALGLMIMWRHARVPHGTWSGRRLAGTMLQGFGIFNLLEGTINHHILQIHHVNETAPGSQWMHWDIGFLIWGAAMLFIGIIMVSRGKRAPVLHQTNHPDRRPHHI